MRNQPTSGQHSLVDLQAKVAFLSRPESFPDPTSTVKVIETHMSWVFVTDQFVYKLKKPVRLSFLDFSTLAKRKHFCEESLRLNRRLAADVYLGVVPLTRDDRGQLRIGGHGESVEWLEKLLRLPEQLMLDVAIRDHRVNVEDVQRFTRVLAAFYRQAQPSKLSPQEYRGRFARAVEADHRELCDVGYDFDTERLERNASAQLALVSRQPGLLDTRVETGKVIEAHGDLRAEHVCLLPQPVFIDCLEFNRDFRLMDMADELSYLAFECEFAGASFIGPTMFTTYADETDDRVPEVLVNFYKTYRAVLRAKLSAWHSKDRPLPEHGKWLRRAAGYLDIAEHYSGLLENLEG